MTIKKRDSSEKVANGLRTKWKRQKKNRLKKYQ